MHNDYKRAGALVAFLMIAALIGANVASSQDATETDSGETYLLRYKFEPGTVMRWDVHHQAVFRTAIGGIKQEDKSDAKSVKIWRVLENDDDGNIVIQHTVEKVLMTNSIDGLEREFNSETDDPDDAEYMFQHVAQTVGKSLFIVTLDDRGREIDRIKKRKYYEGRPEDQITLVFPEEPIPVGHAWMHSFEIHAELGDGMVKKIQMRKKFVLREVSNGIATVSVDTQMLTPIHDPKTKSELIDRLWDGEVLFDIEQGLAIEQQLDIDERLIGAWGPNSKLHYELDFEEEFLDTAEAPAEVVLSTDAELPQAGQASLTPDATGGDGRAMRSRADTGAAMAVRAACVIAIAIAVIALIAVAKRFAPRFVHLVR